MKLNPMRATLLAALLVSGCTTVRQLREPTTLTPNGQAEVVRTDDALDYSVAITIDAPPEVVWKLLVDARSFTAWNSTLVSLEGDIEPGSTIALVSKDAPDRTFELNVTTFEPPRRMVWEDGNSIFMGVRNFALLPGKDGKTIFTMSETFSGGMLGMIEGSLPDFSESFQAFASDLKREAEQRALAAHEPPSSSPRLTDAR